MTIGLACCAFFAVLSLTAGGALRSKRSKGCDWFCPAGTPCHKCAEQCTSCSTQVGEGAWRREIWKNGVTRECACAMDCANGVEFAAGKHHFDCSNYQDTCKYMYDIGNDFASPDQCRFGVYQFLRMGKRK